MWGAGGFMKSFWVRLPGLIGGRGGFARTASIGLLLTLLGVLVFHSSSRTTVLAASAGAAPATNSAPIDQNKILQGYGELPLSFEPNAGQTDARVKFLSRGPGYTVFLSSDEAVLALSAGSKKKQSSSGESAALPMAGFRDISTPRPEPARTSAVLRMRLIGADRDAQIAGADQLPGTTNYFFGKDPRNWRTNVVNYRKVSYRGVYPGIDLVYYGNQRQLEYDFIVAAGSDPEAIKVGFAGAPKMRLDERTGDLVLSTKAGDVRFHKPVAYQMEAESAGEQKHFIESSF